MTGRPGRLGRAQVLLGALAIAAATARWFTRAHLVYGWDTVHYILAQDRYDIRAHQPHPPGSFYYVLLARLVRALGADPHTALLVWSAIFGGLLVLVLFELGRELGGEGAGWLAAVLGATAPLFWFYGSVGLNYGPGGTLGALVALGCVRLTRPGDRAAGALLGGCALGVLGGFRPTDVVFLAPAYFAALLSAARSERGQPGSGSSRLYEVGLLPLGVLTIGWLWPNVASSGGWGGYLEAIHAQDHLLNSSSVLRAGWPALLDTSFTHERCLESMLGAGWLVLPLLAFVGRKYGKPPSTDAMVETPSLPLSLLTGLLVLPAFLFYLLGHFNSPGYALTYSGFVAALAAALVSGHLRGRILVAGAVALGVGNLAVTLYGWPGVGNFGQRAVAVAEIRAHDRYYREVDRYLRERDGGRPIRLLTSWNATDGLRVVETVLPRYEPEVAQAVGAPPPLPPLFRDLTWLRLMTPAGIRKEGRPVYAICRTYEDYPYHQSLFGDTWDAILIGPGDFLLHLKGTPEAGG